MIEDEIKNFELWCQANEKRKSAEQKAIEELMTSARARNLGIIFVSPYK